jgi:hypothetical protein
LRQLPHAALAGRLLTREGVFRRVRDQGAGVRGLRAQHHARQGDRHRLVDGRSDHQRDPQRPEARRHVLRSADVVRLVQADVGHRRARNRRIPAHRQADPQRGAPSTSKFR